MDLDTILFSIVIVMSGLTLLVLIVSVLMEWWLPHWWNIKKWYRIRNQRVRDYDDDDPLMYAYFDGLIDSDWYWKCIHSEWDHTRNERRLLITARASADFHDEINGRYYGDGAQNAYKRALQTLQSYPYCAYDSEMHDLCQQALILRDGRCLRCDGSGWYWEPHGGGMFSETTCECKK